MDIYFDVIISMKKKTFFSRKSKIFYFKPIRKNFTLIRFRDKMKIVLVQIR